MAAASCAASAASVRHCRNDWFMPTMDRSSAVSHLLEGARAPEPGRFVVRGSNKPGLLALTVVKPGGGGRDVWHARVKNEGGQAEIHGHPPFPSLDHLIVVSERSGRRS